MAQRKNYVYDLREHLKGWRYMNGVVLKPLSNKALRSLRDKDGSGHDAPEMRRLLKDAVDICRDPLGKDFVRQVVNLETYPDVSGMVALTYDRHKAKVVGLAMWAKHDPGGINDDEDEDDDGLPIKWQDDTLNRKARDGQVAEITVLCVSQDNPIKGLGRFLTLAMILDIAKARSRGAPRYHAIVTEVAGAEQFSTAKARLADSKKRGSMIKNYNLFHLLGFRETTALDANNSGQEWVNGDDETVVWMTVGFDMVPFNTVLKELSLPKMHGVCPEETKTGRTNCQSWIKTDRGHPRR